MTPVTPWWRALLRAGLIAGSAAVTVAGVLEFRAADWPIYLTVLVLSSAMFFVFVEVLPGLTLPIPHIATTVGFLYVGGLPTQVVTLASSVLVRVVVASWRTVVAWRAAGPAVAAQAGGHRQGFLAAMNAVKTGQTSSNLGDWAVGPIGMGVRWWVVSALAPGGPPVSDAAAIAIAEGAGYLTWGMLSSLPIYPDRMLIPYGGGPRWAPGYRELRNGQAYRSALNDIGLVMVLALTPFVFLIPYGYRAHGLPGAVVWALSSLGLHLMLKRLNERRLTVEEQNRQLEQLNRELQQRERLSAIGQMSSVISHQTLHELGVIGVYADLIRNATDCGDPAAALQRLKDHGAAIEGALGSVNRTLRDLLVFSKDLRLNLYEHSLRRLIEESVDGVRPAAGERGVPLRWECATEATVRLDKLKVMQAVGNVLRNAIEVSPPGVEVLVMATVRDGGVEIAVADGGPGIPARDREAIFTPFFTTKEHGTGLGLAIAREFVSAHGGTLTVEARQPAGGTSFVFRLPLGGP
jgi:signal transduction histidine kinase